MAELLEAGASRVVVGTRAVEELQWLEEVVQTWPGRIILAADVRERSVLTRGWTQEEALDIRALLDAVSALPLAGILVTAVHREGRMMGTDLVLMAEIAGAANVPVTASGGVTTMEELRCLARHGIAAVILGMSLYTGALDAAGVAEEFGR